MAKNRFDIQEKESGSIMKSLVVINACVRQADSRTLRIAEPIIAALSERYAVTRYNLPEMDIQPLDPDLFGRRGLGDIPSWAQEAARAIAGADRILIAAPFWDMSFPAVLKCFIEHTSLFDVTFTDNGKTCVGLCKAPKVLYITTRGMDIRTGDAREQATPYLKAIGSLWNLGEITTIAATNMDYISSDEIDRKISQAVSRGLQIAQSF